MLREQQPHADLLHMAYSHGHTTLLRFPSFSPFLWVGGADHVYTLWSCAHGINYLIYVRGALSRYSTGFRSLASSWSYRYVQIPFAVRFMFCFSNKHFNYGTVCLNLCPVAVCIRLDSILQKRIKVALIQAYTNSYKCR